MTREDILNAVRAHEGDLRKLRVRELALFGSFARGEAPKASDVDFLLDLEVKTFDNYMGVKEHLESLLGRRVDLVKKNTGKLRVRDRILAEAVRAA